MMTDFKSLAEDYWNGTADLLVRDHPVRRFYPGAQEIAPDLLYMKGHAGVSVIDTKAGIVLMDAGTTGEASKIFEAVRLWRPDVPVRAIIVSHHHMDHLWAIPLFDAEAQSRGWERPVVYAHARLSAHIARYRHMQPWHQAINRRQFGGQYAGFDDIPSLRDPDVAVEHPTTITLGQCTIKMFPALGETDDHLWAWVPERRWLFPGDLFIWAVPNAGNPQKVQRYCVDWADALRAMAEHPAELLVCGHGMPIFGAERVRQALCTTAEYLESIETQTVQLMNQALPLDEILQRVAPPAHLANVPYLQPIYDEPEFLVRNIWRRYGGWWDGEPDMLMPAPRAQQAREWIGLAGGTQPVLDRARALHESGDLRMASHLVELAVLAAPPELESAAHSLRTAIYADRAKATQSTMTIGIFSHFARSSELLRRDYLTVAS